MNKKPSVIYKESRQSKFGHRCIAISIEGRAGNGHCYRMRIGEIEEIPQGDGFAYNAITCLPPRRSLGTVAKEEKAFSLIMQEFNFLMAQGKSALDLLSKKSCI